jgi:galactonate dehydratase
MFVTGVETLRADRFMYVKVTTNDGLVGWGELHPASGTGGTPLTAIAAVEYCAEYLLGKDPLAIEVHWQHLFRRCLFRGGSDLMAAIGAIDIALWDIAGKAYDQPVYRLLGGPTRERIRLYTHLNTTTPDELAAEAAARVAQGFTAVRLYPFGPFGISGEGLEQMSFTALQHAAVARVAAVREAVGPDVDVIIDVVNRLTPPEALAVGRALAPYNLAFFEDPIEPENMDLWGDLAARLPMPVATGERLFTIYQFRDLLRAKGAAFVRPDLSLAGGISNCRKIAALAEAEYVGVIPHNPLSAVLTAACVQLGAAIHNLALQEYPSDDDHGTKRALVDAPLQREGGYLLLPTRPGIGLEVNEAALSAYPPLPYTRPALIGRDGGLREY